jgi:ssDNA-binding Zn-finger/Zn-ribbon topoisomerase 1
VNKERKCSSCDEGIMVVRNGPYGEFYGCSKFPECTNSRNSLEESEMPHQRGMGWEDWEDPFPIDYDGDGIGGWAW